MSTADKNIINKNQQTSTPTISIGVQRRVKLRTSSFLCGGTPHTPQEKSNQLYLFDF
jgi:hypothetical protein